MEMDHLSVSQLNLYLQCSLKYRFQYVDRLPKPFKASALAFGSVIHSAIEWMHKERMQGREASLDQLLKIFETDWYTQTVETQIRYKDQETEEDLKRKAQAILTLYYTDGPKAVQAAEIPFEVPLVNLETGETLPVPLKGFMDLIEPDGTVVELKTSARAVDIDTLELQLQLTAYHYAFQVLFQREPKGLKLITLTKTKTPKMTVAETGRSSKDHARLFYIAKEVLNAIKTGVFVPNPTFRCKDCEYFGVCQEWQGNK